MSSSPIWGGPTSFADDTYPLPLLKYLLKQMMAHLGAQGACLALYDDYTQQMKIRLHLRVRGLQGHNGYTGMQGTRASGRRMTVHLEKNDSPSPLERVRHTAQPLYATYSLDDIEDVSLRLGDPFAVDTAYPLGQGLIGLTWRDSQIYTMRQEDYLEIIGSDFEDNQVFPPQLTPTSYMSIPVRESTLVDDVHGEKKAPVQMLGVIVLYQLTPGATIGFQARQRSEASQHAERIALYLQNDRLHQAQQRTSEYLQLLQDISATFPSSVQLSELVKKVHQFTANVVNISSMLLTLYDRDTEKIYDIFALKDDMIVDVLSEHTKAQLKEDRKVWWQVTQEEQKRLLFSPLRDQEMATQYHELLEGAWGEQHNAETFLLLPMKMFKRVVGSLCLTSKYTNAYHPEEIQVLETMVQIITVSIENAKLYERDRISLNESKKREKQAKQSEAQAWKREELMAAMNSALQGFSSVLDAGELFTNFVRSATTLVHAEMSGFFTLSPEKDELIARAIYSPLRVRRKKGMDDGIMDDESDFIPVEPVSKTGHDELIKMVHLPYKDTILELRSENDGFFYLDQSELEALAQRSKEEGKMFLQAANYQPMLFVPVNYQEELIGILAVHPPPDSNYYKPEEVGTLLAICAQAAIAIRNAQLFEQREEAYVELEHMSKLKDEFLVTASHELRTPLSAVIGYSSLLKRSGARLSPAQILKYATKMAEAAQQLSDLVANMTEAANMGAMDKNEMQTSPVQVLLAAEAASGIRVSIEQQIILEIDPALWVNGDPLYIRQVIMNLLDNAAKYSPRDGKIWITAHALTLPELFLLMPEDQIDHALQAEHPNLSVVCISVRDQGEGILLADQERIFEKFVRAPRSLTTPVRGSGLGLYICRRYLEDMHGRLWLQSSTPGEGSVFSFYLPRVDTPIKTVREDMTA